MFLCFTLVYFFLCSLFFNVCVVLYLVDVCRCYRTLSDADRKETYKTPNYKAQCDHDLKEGWYRFQGAAGTQMAVKCPPLKTCGGNFPGWLDGVHPTVAEGIVRRKACFHKFEDCCATSLTIKVKNCGSYYVYQFYPTLGCNLRYCGSD